jgi:hypothetical protein
VRKTLDPPREKETKGEKNYITPAGYHKLTTELDFLQTKKRPEVVSALSDAAAEGDRSENAEYIYRKRQLRQIDGRMRFLGKRLDIAVIVDAREQKRRDRVFFGATVTVEDEEGENKPSASWARTRSTARAAPSRGNRRWAAASSARKSATPCTSAGTRASAS